MTYIWEAIRKSATGRRTYLNNKLIHDWADQSEALLRVARAAKVLRGDHTMGRHWDEVEMDNALKEVEHLLK